MLGKIKSIVSIFELPDFFLSIQCYQLIIKVSDEYAIDAQMLKENPHDAKNLFFVSEALTLSENRDDKGL